MERLSFESDGYYAVSNENCYDDQNEDYCGPAIERLAAYENTGLTPEQVAVIAKDNNVPGKWIPVTERLPDEWTDVLVLSKCGFCVVAVSLGSHGKWRESWTHMMIDDGTVTHWMPLPEPPKEVQQ